MLAGPTAPGPWHRTRSFAYALPGARFPVSNGRARSHLPDVVRLWLVARAPKIEVGNYPLSETAIVAGATCAVGEIGHTVRSDAAGNLAQFRRKRELSASVPGSVQLHS